MLMLHQPLPDIAGAVCNALFVQAYYYRGQLVSAANALFLQLGDAGWHRIFIDGEAPADVGAVAGAPALASAR